MKIEINIMGRSYHVASDLPPFVELPDGATLDAVITEINRQLPDDQSLPPSCLVVHGGKHVGTLAQHEAVTLGDGDELVFVAPVAGG